MFLLSSGQIIGAYMDSKELDAATAVRLRPSWEWKPARPRTR